MKPIRTNRGEEVGKRTIGLKPIFKSWFPAKYRPHKGEIVGLWPHTTNEHDPIEDIGG
jgi:hypothetical protein